MENMEIMSQVEGISFKVLEKAMVADFSFSRHESLFENLSVGRLGEEAVLAEENEAGYEHKFPFFYKYSGLDIITRDGRQTLPGRAFILILPEKETMEIMSQVEGISFTVVGPFMVADFNQDQSLFDNLPVGQHGMEAVSAGESMEFHKHEFTSFYKSVGLNVICKGKKYTLPSSSLTLVLPGVDHSWVAQAANGGKVGQVQVSE
jgi:hypothetical protein